MKGIWLEGRDGIVWEGRDGMVWMEWEGRDVMGRERCNGKGEI